MWVGMNVGASGFSVVLGVISIGGDGRFSVDEAVISIVGGGGFSVDGAVVAIGGGDGVGGWVGCRVGWMFVVC